MKKLNKGGVTINNYDIQPIITSDINEIKERNDIYQQPIQQRITTPSRNDIYQQPIQQRITTPLRSDINQQPIQQRITTPLRSDINQQPIQQRIIPPSRNDINQQPIQQRIIPPSRNDINQQPIQQRITTPLRSDINQQPIQQRITTPSRNDINQQRISSSSRSSKNIFQEKIIGNRIYNDYIQYIRNVKELNDLNDSKQKPKKNYNSIIKYISDYKYYKKFIYSDKKVNNISFSKFKANIIKSRINDYFNLDNFFTSNKDILLNFDKKKETKKSSLESKSLEPLFKSYSKIKKSSNKKFGGALKQDGKDFLSVMHILDSKHDFYDNVSSYTRSYMNESYKKALSYITDQDRRNKLQDLYGNMGNNSKDSYYEENILVETVTKISEGKLIDDINDYGNFQFIDVNNDSTKFIYYPTIDVSKVITENDVDNDTIIKIIRDYFGYDANSSNYKYMYDTKIFINNEISQVLSNKNVTVFSKIANQCKPFENGYDPHPSNEIIIEPTEYNDFTSITNTNFNAPETTPDEYNYSTRNIVRKYINFTIIKDVNVNIQNKYNPVIIFKRFDISKFPQMEIQSQITSPNEIRLNNDCCFYTLLSINGINMHNVIVYTKSFNEKPKVKDYIDNLVNLLHHQPEATKMQAIDNYIKLLITNLRSVSQEDFVLKFIIIYCFYNSDEPNIIKRINDIIEILFDLKKSGDWGQSLFCSKYNNLSPNKDCFFISGDKLSAARSIMTGNVKTVTATDYNKVFSTPTSQKQEKRAVLTLYRNGELMTFKYFISFLQKNIFSFIAFKHIKIHYRYFVKLTPGNPTINENDLITDDNFNFTFFNYFMLIIIYQLRIFYNTYTIIELKTSNKIPYELNRYADCFLAKLNEVLQTLKPSDRNLILNSFKFPANNDILTCYINEDIFEFIYNIINIYYAKSNQIIFTYLTIIDDYYDSSTRPEKNYFETLDLTLIIDILRIIDTKMNNTPKINNIKNDDDVYLIMNEYNGYYATNAAPGIKYTIFNKYAWLVSNSPNDFTKCKNLINAISSYNNICAMLLVDEDYNTNPNFINTIKTKYNPIVADINDAVMAQDEEESRKRKKTSKPKIAKVINTKTEQKTEIKTMIDNFYNKTFDFINIIARYFTNIKNFEELSLDLLLDIHEDNVKDYNYVNANIDTIFTKINKYLPEDKRNIFIFSYYTYAKITHASGQEYKTIINDFKNKIKIIWDIYPELNLETKSINKTLNEYEEKIYKDYKKFISDPNIKPPPKSRKTTIKTQASITTNIKKPNKTIPVPIPTPIPVPMPIKKSSKSSKQLIPTPIPVSIPTPIPIKKSSKSVKQQPLIIQQSQGLQVAKSSKPLKVKSQTQPPPLQQVKTQVNIGTQSRSGRQIKPSAKNILTGGVPAQQTQKKNDEKKNKLSSRLYSYVLTELLPYYNYKLCIDSANMKDEIINFFKEILINTTLTDIICVKNRINYYNELLLYRIIYLNKIIEENINIFIDFINNKITPIIFNGFKMIDELIIDYYNIENLNATIQYIEQINEGLLSIKSNYENTLQTIQTILYITTSVNPISTITSITINTMKQNIDDINNNIKNIQEHYFKDSALSLKESITNLSHNFNKFITNRYSDYYTNIYYYNTNIYKSNTSLDDARKNIHILKESITVLLQNTRFDDDNLILILIFTIATFAYSVMNFTYIYKNEVIADTSKLNKDIIIEIFEIINIIKTYKNKIDEIKGLNEDIIDAINVAKSLLDINYNMIVIFNSYLLILFNIANINNIILTSLKIEIDKLNLIIYDTDVNINETIQKINKTYSNNKFLSLFVKQEEIRTNITGLYPNHEEFNEKKRNGYIPILIQSDVYPVNMPSLFLNKTDLKKIKEPSSKKPATSIKQIRQSRKMNEEYEDNDELGNQIGLEKTNINALYSALLTKARTVQNGKPININITDKSLLNIFDTYFKNVNMLGTTIIRNEKVGQGAATSGYYYNENIIIQDIIFITIIANHFKEIIEYKGKKIFEIINTIEKDNTYKIHSFVKSKNNYYNSDNYKILTIVYACLYNIIKIKHDALLLEKEKGRDKYNFIGYYGKKNKYGDVEKLFSVFDVIMEITKSN